MNAPNTVEQGRTYDFDFALSGEDATAFTTTFNVLQYPGGTPAITRAMTVEDCKYIGSLTGVETAALAVGQWFISINAVDSDEDLAEPVKLYVTAGWT